MYKKDLVLNNLWGLICHKTKLNQTNHSKFVAEKKLNFCLARNLIWPLESPNIFTQSRWPVLFSPNHIS